MTVKPVLSSFINGFMGVASPLSPLCPASDRGGEHAMRTIRVSAPFAICEGGKEDGVGGERGIRTNREG